ncbi:hypothetical protein GYMLUDRAFT_236323 [Collybiopsis luxurians FD-317 M1]|nr:hypothetical protein GYMLUDRAFT_236323 [Collybiopsis luxurians FD-317 M1]
MTIKTKEEQEKHSQAVQEKLCFNCGGKGHFASDPNCPQKGLPQLFVLNKDGLAEEEIDGTSAELQLEESVDQVGVENQNTEDGAELIYEEYEVFGTMVEDSDEEQFGTMNVISAEDKLNVHIWGEPFIKEIIDESDPEEEGQKAQAIKNLKGPILENMSDDEVARIPAYFKHYNSKPVVKEMSTEGLSDASPTACSNLVDTNDSDNKSSDGYDCDSEDDTGHQVIEVSKFSWIDRSTSEHPVFNKIVKGALQASTKVRVPLMKGKEKLRRPKRGSLSDCRLMTCLINIGDHVAHVMFDTGSSLEPMSPHFACVSGIKVQELEEPMSLQLGTVGSKAKFNYGTVTEVILGDNKMKTYFDIVNIDKYDAIFGIWWMREHNVRLDPKHNVIYIDSIHIQGLTHAEDNEEVQQRMAMRQRLDGESIR